MTFDLSTLGRLCMPAGRVEHATPSSYAGLARRLMEPWRIDLDHASWAGASNGSAMLLVQHHAAGDLPLAPDVVLTVATGALWPKPAASVELRHTRLLEWADVTARSRKPRSYRRQRITGEVLRVTLDASLLATVLETAPPFDVVRLRSNPRRHYVDLCGPGWAARVMGVMDKKKPARVLRV